MFKIVSFSALLICAVACVRSHPPSDEYLAMKKMPVSAWASYSQSLPLGRRLRLYEDLYERSGHPPDTRLAGTFLDDPEAAYLLIESRLKETKTPDRYFAILYKIEAASPETMCKNSRRKFVRDTLMRGDVNHPYAGLFEKPCAT